MFDKTEKKKPPRALPRDLRLPRSEISHAESDAFDRLVVAVGVALQWSR